LFMDVITVFSMCRTTALFLRVQRPKAEETCASPVQFGRANALKFASRKRCLEDLV
jgi:hypothetical protein